jgi:ABC-2 type transport system ATP-binding protein
VFVILEPSHPRTISGKKTMSEVPSGDLIRAEGLTKYYGDFTAIRDVSFSVPRGSITAFLGPNGAGKSTTLRCLTGFLAPTSGQAFIAGHDMMEDRLKGSQRLGYLGESGALYPELTPASYLRFIGGTRGLGKSELSRSMERVAADCQLSEVWNKPIRKLSRGFRQRVGLAQAMLHDPQVLILDEPTLGLDPNQIVVVRELIRSFAQDKAVLISTHILQEVEALADQIIVISEGQLQFTGDLATLKEGRSLEDRFHELTGNDGQVREVTA